MSSAGRIRLGGPVFIQTDDPEKLASEHRRLGYRAAYCPRIGLGEADRIRALETAFAHHEVTIAEVGRWVNLLDADPAKRRANLQTVIDGLALADEIGAACCVDIAGSFDTQTWYGPHPDNLGQRFFDAAVENARRIIDAVKPKRAKFCYEMMAWSLPDSPDSNLRMLRAVDRDAFAVHLDPCNLVNSPDRFYRNSDLIRECYDKLGPWIVSAHAKDLTWDVEMSIHFREVRPGLGKLDYSTLLRCHARLAAEVPLMMEHLAKPEEYDQARSHLFALGDQLGVAF
jgi:sugar phosphate isomerase/epimerase